MEKQLYSGMTQCINIGLALTCCSTSYKSGRRFLVLASLV